MDIQNNYIESNHTELIQILNSLQNLRVLYLKGNPITRNITFYRKTLIKEIENLTYLDDRPVNEGDRLASQAFFSGGLEAERKAREDYRKSREMTFKYRDLEKDTTREPFEERRKKALESLKNEYVSRKDQLESKKRKLMKELEETPEKKMEILRELRSLDYQIEENEKFKINQEEDVYHTISKREKLDRFSTFEYEDWMDALFEMHIVENLFDFPRAVKLIGMDLKTRNVKNWELFNELDLRSKWTEIELKKFRKGEETDEGYIKQIIEEENDYDKVKHEKEKEREQQKLLQRQLEIQKEIEEDLKKNNSDSKFEIPKESKFIQIKEESISEEEFKGVEEVVDTSHKNKSIIEKFEELD